MRIKPGRPDIAKYRNHFDIPDSTSESPLTVTWMGVSTLLVDDGTTALLTDGFFSRPNLIEVGARKLRPSPSRIDAALARAGIDRLEAVLPVHTHYDHAMDSAAVAQRTGARVIGGRSAANIARGGGLPDDRIVIATPGMEVDLGNFGVTLVESGTARLTGFPG